MAHEIVTDIQSSDGLFVRIDNEVCVLQRLPDRTYRYRIDYADPAFEQWLYAVAHVTRSQYDAKLIADRVRLKASRLVSAIQTGNFSLYEPPSKEKPVGCIYTADVSGVLKIDHRGVERLTKPTCYVTPVRRPWRHHSLTPTDKQTLALIFKALLADTQARPYEGRLALALACTLLPFFRQRLDARPIFQMTGPQSSGKSFCADRFAYLLYGESALESATEAALRRDSEPLVILDDIERLDQWLKDHLRRSATGSRHKSVKNNQGMFGIDDSGPQDSIYILTAIRIPTDVPLISRLWLFSFSKDYFNPAFNDELKVREQIKSKRGYLLSFLLDVLSETLKLERKSGLPDVSGFGRLPVERTALALRLVFLMLQAFDRLAPRLVDPVHEFDGLLANLRKEEEGTLGGQTTNELTLLANLFEKAERDVCWPELDYEDSQLIGTATGFSAVLHQEARLQGIRLAHDMNAVNVGKWFSSEVRNSKEFTVEETSIGTGDDKRKAWRVGRKGISGQDQVPADAVVTKEIIPNGHVG